MQPLTDHRPQSEENLRATLFDRNGQASLATQDWQRALAVVGCTQARLVATPHERVDELLSRHPAPGSA